MHPQECLPCPWSHTWIAVGGKMAGQGLKTPSAGHTIQPLFKVSSNRIETTSFQGCIQALSCNWHRDNSPKWQSAPVEGVSPAQLPRIQQRAGVSRTRTTAFVHPQPKFSKFHLRINEAGWWCVLLFVFFFRFTSDCLRAKASISLPHSNRKTDLNNQQRTSAAAVEIISDTPGYSLPVGRGRWFTGWPEQQAHQRSVSLGHLVCNPARRCSSALRWLNRWEILSAWGIQFNSSYIETNCKKALFSSSLPRMQKWTPETLPIPHRGFIIFMLRHKYIKGLETPAHFARGI